MATTARETSQGKEKTPKSKSSTTPATTQGRKTSKPFVASSTANKGLAILTDKPSPHYLRPTISSTKDPCSYPKKQASDDESLTYSHGRRKSIEKTAAPAQLKRTVSANSRQTRIKTPSPLKNTPLKASASGRITKAWAPKASKPQPVAKPGSVKKTTTAPTTTTTKSKKGSKPSTKNPTNPNTNTPSQDATKTPPSAKAEESKLDIDGNGEELIEVAKEELVQVESSPVDDQTFGDPPEPELLNSGSGYSSTLTEDPELVSKSLTQDSEDMHQEVAISEDTPTQKDQCSNIEDNKNDHSEENIPENVVNVEKPAGRTGEDGKTDSSASVQELGDEDGTRKLNFKQGKELEVKEGESEGLQKLKFKERKEDTETKEEKVDSENVQLKHQDVQGRKESPAYNDVIEETASKLVGKRKSKVKALVGAFETVINLENDAPQTEGVE